MNHLVIYKRILEKNYIDWMFKGLKTVDIKFQHNKRYPWKNLLKGDQLYIKESGGPVVGIVEVKSVEFHEISAWQDSYILLEPYIESLNLRDEAHLEKICRKNEGKRYLIVFQLTKPLYFNNHIQLYKRDQRSWVKDFIPFETINFETASSDKLSELRNSLLSHYKLDIPRLICTESGSINSNYKVLDGKEKYILKKYSDMSVLGYKRDKTYFEQEIGFINTLIENGINAVKQIETSENTVFFEHNHCQYSLYPFIEGKSLDFTNENGFDYSFKIMGQIHKATAKRADSLAFNRKWRGGLFFEHFVKEEYPRWISKMNTKSLERSLHLAFEIIRQKSSDLYSTKVYPIHADIGPHNILKKSNRIYILDFDNARIGHFEEDFGISLALYEYFSKTKINKKIFDRAMSVYMRSAGNTSLNQELIDLYKNLMIVRLKYLYKNK